MITFMKLPHYSKVKKPIFEIKYLPPIKVNGVKISNPDIRLYFFGRAYHIIFSKRKKERI